jgi:hypothetical protein
LDESREFINKISDGSARRVFDWLAATGKLCGAWLRFHPSSFILHPSSFTQGCQPACSRKLSEFAALFG